MQAEEAVQRRVVDAEAAPQPARRQTRHPQNDHGAADALLDPGQQLLLRLRDFRPNVLVFARRHDLAGRTVVTPLTRHHSHVGAQQGLLQKLLEGLMDPPVAAAYQIGDKRWKIDAGILLHSMEDDLDVQLTRCA